MPAFFDTPSAFGAWLAEHGTTEVELVVGFYKRGSGIPSMTWPESVDEALCHGWIDGVRANIDERAYRIRFTPRKATSTWSAINIGRVAALQAEGRMRPAGLEAFAQRREDRSRTYAYEQREEAQFETAQEARFRKNKVAWTFFQAQPPGYRHRMTWRVVSAKQATTRDDRLSRLIDASARSERL